MAVTEDDSQTIQELLQLWKPGCFLVHESLDEEECPVCFGGNIRTVFGEAGAHFQCGDCGVDGTTFDMKPGR
jgi:hypothetical protein